MSGSVHQGLTLVHSSPQYESFLSLKLFETTQCIHKECSHQAEKWTSVSPWRGWMDRWVIEWAGESVCVEVSLSELGVSERANESMSECQSLGLCKCPTFGASDPRPRSSPPTSRQGLTLVHFSAQPEPFRTQNTPRIPPNTSLHPLHNPKVHPLSHRKRLR